MFWIVLFALLALAIGVLAPFTTVRIGSEERQRNSAPVLFRLTIVWPSGPVTYQWPKRDGGSAC